jgi:hypothetical protein
MRMTALARTSSNCKRQDLSSRKKGCYIRTISASIQLENKFTGRESQGDCRQDELIGGKLPVVKLTLTLTLTLTLIDK